MPYATRTSAFNPLTDSGQREYVSISKRNETNALLFNEGNMTVAVARRKGWSFSSKRASTVSGYLIARNVS